MSVWGCADRMMILMGTGESFIIIIIVLFYGQFRLVLDLLINLVIRQADHPTDKPTIAVATGQRKKHYLNWPWKPNTEQKCINRFLSSNNIPFYFIYYNPARVQLVLYSMRYTSRRRWMNKKPAIMLHWQADPERETRLLSFIDKLQPTNEPTASYDLHTITKQWN